MPSFLAYKQLFSPSKPVWWAGVLLSLGVGGVFYVATAQLIEHDAEDHFRRQARQAQYRIAATLAAYTDVLRSTASFLHASDSVDRLSFHRYVSGLDLARRFPALDNINVAQHVMATEQLVAGREFRLDGKAAQAGKDAGGYPDFAVKPAGRRADYTVITLIEPVEPFRHKVGLDIAARAPVAAALARARDTGVLATSGQPIDVAHHQRDTGLGMRLPLYRQDLPLNTVEQRRAAYLGSVGLGFSVARLMQTVLDSMSAHPVRLSLYDGGETGAAAGKEMLLHDSAGLDSHTAPSRDQFAVMLPIDFNGRLWKAYFTAPRNDWYSSLDHYLPWLALLGGFAGSMLFFLLFHTLSSSRLRAIRMAKAMTKELRASQAKLQLSHHKLRRLAAHADQIKEQERKRIAREIHDDLGQNLLVLRIEADMLATRTRHRHPRLHARARSTLVQIDSTIKSVRHLINDLRPTVLDLGLSAAVEWQIAQFRQRSGMVCELIEHQNEISIDDHCATAFFRVLQESLSNIVQHAKASLVRVELRQAYGMLTMTISDNGVGIRPTSRNKIGSFGLVGIEERISLLGGKCSINGSPHAGTTVVICVPVEYQPPVLMPDDINETARLAADVAG